MRRRVRDALWRIGDRLCSHRLTFEAGHWVGELGWLLRNPGTQQGEEAGDGRARPDR